MNLNNYPQYLLNSNWRGSSSMDSGWSGGHNNWANIQTSKEVEKQKISLHGIKLVSEDKYQTITDPKRKILSRNTDLDISSSDMLEDITIVNTPNPFLFGDNKDKNPNQDLPIGEVRTQKTY
jgi:hypothetical protein